MNESPMIVRVGNLCKFTQNAELKNLLLNTGNKLIVEAHQDSTERPNLYTT